MRARFLESYNLINLLKNGGLAMAAEASSPPPFWSVSGAQLLGTPGSNQYGVVRDSTPNSANGATNYFRVILASSDIVEISYDFYSRFVTQTAGKAVPPWIEDVEGSSAKSPFAPAANSKWSEVYAPSEETTIRGSKITASFSARIAAGSVSVTLRFENRPANTDYKDFVLYNPLSSSEWVRPVKTHDLGNARVTRMIIRLQRKVAGSSEIHLGNFALVTGSHSFVPFTGDLMAEAIPKGAIVFAMGEYCPPGFEKLSFTSPIKSGRIFPKNSDGSMEQDGVESHDHMDSMEMSMNPAIDWSTIPMIPAVQRPDPTTIEEARETHTHPLSEAYNIPPSKDVIMCRRL